MADIQIKIEATESPATLKFVVNRILTTEPVEYASSGDTHTSPLAAKLFGFPWTNSVLIGADFVSVTKQDWVDWDVLAEPLAGLIREHLERGEPVLVANVFKPGHDFESENDSPIVKQIKQILNQEIRPIVAMHDGDVAFADYKDGILSIHMKGSCSGCSSATDTLKGGIEVRFKELLPEIKEVVSV